MVFNTQLFKNTLLFLILAELVSLTSFVYPWLNLVGFFIVLIITLVLSLKKLEWGIYIVLAELFVGSFGQLFSFEIGEFSISIRIALFIVVMAVWAARAVVRKFTQNYTKTTSPLAFWRQEASHLLKGENIRNFVSTKIGKWYIALAVILTFGFINGVLRNDFASVFFDFNNWLYFLYLLPFYSIFVSREDYSYNSRLGFISESNSKETLKPVQGDKTNVNVSCIIAILSASLIVLSVQTIILEWIFAHQASGLIDVLYLWMRDYRIGEITFFANNFYRVFIQSQIWLLFGFFIFTGILFTGYKQAATSKKAKLVPMLRGQKRQETKQIIVMLFLISTSLMISFSRSLWLGWVAGVCVFFLILLFVYKWKFIKALKLGLKFIGALVGIGLFILMLISVPPVKDAGGLGILFSNRLTQVDSAGSSRINLLLPLWKEIKKSPVLGSGFGTTVTYTSSDPRILNTTAGASGEHTTYAFEWGYMDTLLKIGIVGLFVYLGLLLSLVKSAWQHVKLQVSNSKPQILFGFFLALISLLVIHAFTPYLNHPLGIGFIILTTVLILKSYEKPV